MAVLSGPVSMARISLRSPPTANAPPEPAITRTSTPGSVRTARATSRTAAYIARLSAFLASGRSRVSHPTRSRTSYRTDEGRSRDTTFLLDCDARYAHRSNLLADSQLFEPTFGAAAGVRARQPV